MGAMLSCWRAKPSTIEVLEKIDKEINALEEFKEKNQRLQKIWVGRLVLYSSTLYIIAFIIVYLWCLPEEWNARLTLALPGFLFPLLVWLIRKILIWLFCKRTERNSEALEDLKVQKKKILEEVMEKETYKNAKLILERFDPESKKAKELDQMTSGMPATPRPGQELRQRSSTQKAQVPSTPQNVNQGSPRPLPVTTPVQQSTSAPGGPPEKTLHSVSHTPVLGRRTMPPAASVPGMGLHPPGPPLARPILPRDRGAVDRVIEYLVGDGPQNRYALICQQCFSHNGMALKEEFEYVAFRCAYCFFLNPARKTRPQAPRLPDFNFEKRTCCDSPSSVGSQSAINDSQPANEPSQDAETQNVTPIHDSNRVESGEEGSTSVAVVLPDEGQIEPEKQLKENENDIEMTKVEESAEGD
ncbi:endoplasmic reticulum junction formation protein lunapark isoform X2 [Rhincodon typus]|uniref:endoplasmic reticulum junction formation protein lunapark isoform X2 n=1 Tax=Rhincodon typus TaxID=259920 RepID=UPI0009A27105|nr:endoplasmic reticulum junction formation protein lunapark isoform X2 [Rhincodon typus]XP_048454793.1 endoplasmic reticulum junction formation protein lunapark isoform X2 [Rhincodon typus]XP_048454794.1 endoplasmic reticulum junction formation protein lunapark isoform X2 [Rhincodon typus]